MKKLSFDVFNVGVSILCLTALIASTASAQYATYDDPPAGGCYGDHCGTPPAYPNPPSNLCPNGAQSNDYNTGLQEFDTCCMAVALYHDAVVNRVVTVDSHDIYTYYACVNAVNPEMGGDVHYNYYGCTWHVDNTFNTGVPC